MKRPFLTLLLAGTVSLTGYSQNVHNERKPGVTIHPAVIEYPRQDLPLYPNPASQHVMIKLFETHKKTGYVMQIHTSAGILVSEKIWNGEKIDVSAFAAGIYMVTLKRKQEVYSQKLVVTR